MFVTSSLSWQNDGIVGMKLNGIAERRVRFLTYLLAQVDVDHDARLVLLLELLLKMRHVLLHHLGVDRFAQSDPHLERAMLVEMVGGHG
jgi:hypothetical protein